MEVGMYFNWLLYYTCDCLWLFWNLKCDIWITDEKVNSLMWKLTCIKIISFQGLGVGVPGKTYILMIYFI